MLHNSDSSVVNAYIREDVAGRRVLESLIQGLQPRDIEAILSGVTRIPCMDAVELITARVLRRCEFVYPTEILLMVVYEAFGISPAQVLDKFLDAVEKRLADAGATPEMAKDILSAGTSFPKGWLGPGVPAERKPQPVRRPRQKQGASAVDSASEQAPPQTDLPQPDDDACP